MIIDYVTSNSGVAGLFTKEDVQKCFEDGEVCILCLSDEGVAGFCWIGNCNSKIYQEFKSLMPIENDVVVFNKDYVSEKYRGKGVYSLIVECHSIDY